MAAERRPCACQSRTFRSSLSPLRAPALSLPSRVPRPSSHGRPCQLQRASAASSSLCRLKKQPSLSSKRRKGGVREQRHRQNGDKPTAGHLPPCTRGAPSITSFLWEMLLRPTCAHPAPSTAARWSPPAPPHICFSQASGPAASEILQAIEDHEVFDEMSQR
jgi:hypothetical protein